MLEKKTSVIKQPWEMQSEAKQDKILYWSFLRAFKAFVKLVILASTVFQAYLTIKPISIDSVERQVLCGTHFGNRASTEFWEITML